MMDVIETISSRITVNASAAHVGLRVRGPDKAGNGCVYAGDDVLVGCPVWHDGEQWIALGIDDGGDNLGSVVEFRASADDSVASIIASAIAAIVASPALSRAVIGWED